MFQARKRKPELESEKVKVIHFVLPADGFHGVAATGAMNLAR
jgi:hypothetical protein